MPPAPTARGLLFEEDDAHAVAARLRRDGFDARVERARFAGEDDDEDQPWAVLTDAPTFVLELALEDHDGWLDVAEPPPTAPLRLPAAPKRHHRPPPSDVGGAP